jgi:hypothetical protein
MQTIKTIATISTIAGMENTTITLRESTKDELDKFGKKGDTYDEIISRLMQENDHMKFLTGE